MGRPGEVVALCSAPEAVEQLRWSPDGRWLSFVARTADPHAAEADDRRPPRRVTRLSSRLDDVGWVLDRPLHVHVVGTPLGGAATGVVRDLTPGRPEFTDASWLPDSSGLVAVGDAHDTWDLDLARDLYRLPLDGAGPERVTGGAVALALPAVAADGARVAVVGVADPEVEPQNSRVGVVDLATGALRWVDAGIDRTWHAQVGARPPIWLDAAHVLLTLEDRGDQHAWVIDVATGAPGAAGTPAVPLVVGERVVGGLALGGGTLAYQTATATRPGEIAAVSLAANPWAAGPERSLSQVTAAFVTAVGPRAPERFTAGPADVDVWVFLPVGFDPAQAARWPALVNVHGGPFAQYGNRFFDEAQVQAGAGYVVVLSNPRGSSGRDQAFARAIAGPRSKVEPGQGWGSVDADDVMAVTDEVLRRYPAVDPARVGLLGGSYGGYMTSWLVTRTRRFAAACSERAVNDLLALEATSDAAGSFRTIVGVEAHDDPDEYRRMSPITYVRDIATPMLLLHSEDDLRCPIGQAEALFTALRRMGRDVELVRFPGEGHELSRSGSPVHRIRRAEIILDFFATHLGGLRPPSAP
jgi:dipeptidyl aminopeptidase/acylaminoacyl peptidase